MAEEAVTEIEEGRYQRIKTENGRAEALKFMAENVVSTYRKTVLQRRMPMYRSRLIERYVSAKRIIARETFHDQKAP